MGWVGDGWARVKLGYVCDKHVEEGKSGHVHDTIT